MVVGMSAINYYAKSQIQAIVTLDYDIFLEPELANVRRAIQCLKQLGFTIGTAAGRLKVAELPRAVKVRRTLVATTSEGIMVELLLAVSGFSFAELANDAKTLSLRGVAVKVGRIEKLLQSKKLAGRPKDRAFLSRYASLFDHDNS